MESNRPDQVTSVDECGIRGVGRGVVESVGSGVNDGFDEGFDEGVGGTLRFGTR